MSIIWCGGEEIDFVSMTGTNISFGSSNYRSAYSRGNLTMGGSGNPTFLVSKNFTSVSSNTWIHTQWFYQNAGVVTYDCFPFGLRNSVTGDAIGVGINSNFCWSIGKRTSGGTVTWFISEGAKNVLSQLMPLDIHIETYGSSGVIRFYINGVLRLTYSGDITVGSTTDFDQVQLRSMNTSWATMFSEIIVADEDTRLMSLKTLAPNAAGDASQWDGTYANIDETVVSDADTVYTDTVEEDMQFNLTGMPVGNFICKGVKIAFRATDGVGGIGVQAGIKTNSALHLGNTIVLGGVWEEHEQLYTQNPETINRFTTAEIDALQIAFRSKSTA